MKFFNWLLFPVILTSGLITGFLGAAILYLIPDRIKAKAMEFINRERNKYINREPS